MAFRHGKKTGVAFNGADITRYLNEANPSHAIDTAETSAFGQDAKTYVVGLTDGTISLAGMFDGSADAIDDVVEEELGVENGAHVLVQRGYVTDDSPGIPVQFCNGELTSYEVSAPTGDVVSVSMEIQADGGLFSGVILHDPNGASNAGFYDVAAAADNNVSSVDNEASSDNGYAAQLHVVANTLDGNLIVTVEHSTDDATFSTLDTFATIGAATTSSEQITGSGTVNRYVRINVDATAAASGSATLAVGFARPAADYL